MEVKKPIIKGFTLGAVKWEVKVDNDRLDDMGAYGFSDYDKSLVLIQELTDKKERTDLAIEQTLYHEVVHSILNSMGEREISANEQFVQQFSLLLHQFVTTKK